MLTVITLIKDDVITHQEAYPEIPDYLTVLKHFEIREAHYKSLVLTMNALIVANPNIRYVSMNLTRKTIFWMHCHPQVPKTKTLDVTSKMEIKGEAGGSV